MGQFPNRMQLVVFHWFHVVLGGGGGGGELTKQQHRVLCLSILTSRNNIFTELSKSGSPLDVQIEPSATYRLPPSLSPPSLPPSRVY